MAINDEIFAALDDPKLSDIAQQLRLTPGQVKTALANALPTVLDGLNTNVQNAAGAASLTQALADHAGTDPFGDLNVLASGPLGDGIVKNVFGNRVNDVARTVAERSKVSTADAERLLKIAAPAVLAFLADKVAAGNAADPDTVIHEVRTANDQAQHDMPDLGTILGGLFGRH